MAVSYKKLWKKLIDRGWKHQDLATRANISTSTMAKLGKNQTVSMDIIERICSVLDCDISEVMEFSNQENPNGN